MRTSDAGMAGYRRNAPAGHEEARALWEQARRHSPRFKVPFDQAWFADALVATIPDRAIDARAAPAPTRPAAAAERGAPAAPVVAAAEHDWGEAPDVGNVHGRPRDLAMMTRWTLSDRCRVVALLGLGGIHGTVRLWKVSSGACLHVLRAEHRYERLDITGLARVTETQRVALLALGAVKNGT